MLSPRIQSLFAVAAALCALFVEQGCCSKEARAISLLQSVAHFRLGAQASYHGETVLCGLTVNDCGEPIPKANIEIATMGFDQNGNCPLHMITVTDKNGYYEFHDLPIQSPSAQVSISVRHATYIQYVQSVAVTRGQAHVAILTLQDGMQKKCT